MKKIWRIILWVVILVSACASPAQSGGVIVSEAWGRPSPKEAMTGAFYMKIQNNGGAADKFIAVSTEACGMAELHESYMTPEGAMGMKPVEGGFIEIPAGGEVELKVGGLHVMCMQKNNSFFAPGSQIPLVLTFEKAGEIQVTVEIREQ